MPAAAAAHPPASDATRSVCNKAGQGVIHKQAHLQRDRRHQYQSSVCNEGHGMLEHHWCQETSDTICLQKLQPEDSWPMEW